ncbi:MULTISPECIES: cytochrome c oxidase subunit II [Nesterenkonia]|uniref:cytochrome-c oxidase n=1 Tax=Nesterenkonia xinjiangensis TaxID=225327 RepID=A0A7Z0GPS7_9MICC|nr:cytochrome c oxidase subunit II [Nesterenkonia sp. HG001]MDZ5077947.1 cytochrome c oxidase subunit II [Nesterenkonia sp. HG001]NYJ79449.1 cytochrome c oxidase subunit 2 [Nesterenkonia xinjiangensis]
MSSQKRTGSRGQRAVKGMALASAAALVLTGCSEQVQRGWLPGSRETTSNTAELTDLWVNSWIAALAVGLLTWGLMLWCMVAYRRRKGETGYPRQLAYNIPLEIMYTIVPLVMVGVLFFYTDQVQRSVDEAHADPDLVVDVRGKQWAWDFNYSYDGDERYFAGTQAHLTGEEGVREQLPTLYLPVDQSVTFELNSRDVIHSFWIPAFLQKRDMIPGRTTEIHLTPQEEGSFDGKCAELCGEYHSEMLFTVEVVSEQEFRDYLETLPEGHLGDEYDRNINLHDDVTATEGD